MRDYLNIYINGQSYEVSGSDAWLTLSDFLRRRLRLTGTKIVCEEGDCGACSVLVADLQQPKPKYQSIDSCIAFLFQLDGYHIVTVEALADKSELTTVQQAMVDCHGSQCGYCTPGFVMSMTGVMERVACEDYNDAAADDVDWPLELSGNLCRCTGYRSILDACEQLNATTYSKLSERFPIQALQALYAPFELDSIYIADGDDKCFIPATLQDCLELRKDYPQARLVAGATDVGVQSNKNHAAPSSVIVLRHIPELRAIDVGSDAITFGACVTWSEMLPICDMYLAAFSHIVNIFGSPQIRNMGTLGGNLANASPIADSLPMLHVLDCELELASVRGRRRVNINDFYLAYKKFDLQPDEIIASVGIPRLHDQDRLKLYKVSRRRDMDISTFTAAIRMHVEDGQIEGASIACGAVGPVVLRLRRAEAYLIGKPFSLDTMQAASEVVVDEITPISDVRGSATYRNLLARNALVKFFHEAAR
jgi:xanthine dehydrogenase small subunit